MRKKITKTVVDEATAPEGKRLVIFDTELSGFCLRVTSAGHRTYQVRYRMGGRGAPKRTYTIGEHGKLTAEQARTLAKALLGDVARGIDPAQAKAVKASEEKGAQTIEALSGQYLEIHGSTALKPRSLEEYARTFRQHINPKIGGLKVKDVVHGDIVRLRHALKHIPVMANRTVAILSSFFNWCILNGYRPDRQNPCEGVPKFKETARERYLSAEEIGAVGQAIADALIAGEITPSHAVYFRCLMLTGLRRDELRTLQWAGVNFERGTLELLDPKVADKGRASRTVPVSAPVLEILAGVQRIEDNPYVFVGKLPGKPLINIAKAWKRVLARAGIAATRPHDLRHTVASLGVAGGASLELIGGVLGHRSPQTTKRYAHLAESPVRSTADLIGRQVSAALNGEAGQVVPLRKVGPR